MGRTVRSGFLNLSSSAPTLTISGDAVTVTDSFHKLAGEGGVADNLDTINGGNEGDLVMFVAADGAVDITLLDSGNLKLEGPFTMNVANDTITLVKIGSNWTEQARADTA